MRHLISLKEQTKEEILTILDLAQKIKAKRNAGELTNYLPNKTMVMLFEKTSTRTRLSFEAGMTELGGHAIFVDSRTTQITFADFVDEISAVLRYGQIFMFRAKKASDVIKAASLNKIPVIDACSEKYHPAQTMGDLLTMIECAGNVENIKKLVYLGIESNVSNTMKLACTKLGIKMTLVSPEADPSGIDEEINKISNESEFIDHELNFEKALEGADFIYTDAWLNMEFFAENGEAKPEFKEEYERRKKLLLPFQINTEIINKYAPNAKIMHCMPCHLGYEITADAVHHPNSVIFDQAENRMHAQKGIIMWLLEKENMVQ